MGATRIWVASLFLITFFPFRVLADTRAIEIGGSSPCSLRTSLGFATVLELPVKPQTVVVGDQDAFKIESMGTNLSIKPLLRKARTNLFLSHDTYKISCTVIAEPKSIDPDFRILFRYTDPPEVKASKSRPRRKLNLLGKAAHTSGVSLTVTRLDLSRTYSDQRDANLVSILVSSKKLSIPISSGSFGVRVRGNFVEIEELYLDAGSIVPGKPVTGTFAVLNEALDRANRLEVVFAFNDRESRTQRITVALNLSETSRELLKQKGADAHAKAVDLFKTEKSSGPLLSPTGGKPKSP